MTTRHVLLAFGISALGMVSGSIQGQDNAPSGSSERQSQVAAEPPIHPNEPAGQQQALKLDDVELASWLIVQNKIYAHLSGHAATRAQREEVRQFAAKVGQSHDQLLAALHARIETNGEQIEIGGTLKEIGQRLEQVNEARRRVAGFRGQPEQARESAENSDLNRKIREQREEVREQRQEVREEAGERGIRNRDDTNNHNVRAAREQLDEHTKRLAELRRQRREAIGQVLRDAIPTIRENLPATIDSIASLIEKAEVNSPDLSLIRFESQLADRWAETMRQELDRNEGESFDRSYLKFTILFHAKMVDALTLAQSAASQQMRPVIDQSLASTQEHLQQARDLLQQQTPAGENH